MVLLADQAFAAEFSAAMSGGAIGWLITLACYAGIIVAVAPVNWKKLAPVRTPTTTTTIANPDGHPVLLDEAKDFVELKKAKLANITKLEQARVDMMSVKQKEMQDADTKLRDLIEAEKNDISQGELLINQKVEVTP